MTMRPTMPATISIPAEELQLSEALEDGVQMLRAARQALTAMVMESEANSMERDDLNSTLSLVGRAIDSRLDPLVRAFETGQK